MTRGNVVKLMRLPDSMVKVKELTVLVASESLERTKDSAPKASASRHQCAEGRFGKPVLQKTKKVSTTHTYLIPPPKGGTSVPLFGYLFFICKKLVTFVKMLRARAPAAAYPHPLFRVKNQKIFKKFFLKCLTFFIASGII